MTPHAVSVAQALQSRKDPDEAISIADLASQFPFSQREAEAAIYELRTARYPIAETDETPPRYFRATSADALRPALARASQEAERAERVRMSLSASMRLLLFGQSPFERNAQGTEVDGGGHVLGG